MKQKVKCKIQNSNQETIVKMEILNLVEKSALNKSKYKAIFQYFVIIIFFIAIIYMQTFQLSIIVCFRMDKMN